MALTKASDKAYRKTYLSISHGAIRHTNNTTGVQESYASVEGTLTDIYLKTRAYNGLEGEFWYIDLRDDEDIYSLSFPYPSGIFKSIINSLSSDGSLNTSKKVTIEPYQKNGFTKVLVYVDGLKLDWAVKEMPPVKDIVLPNGAIVKDDGVRMEFIENLVETIRGRIGITKPLRENR